MSAPTGTRKWYRLHASTWVAVGIVAVGLVLIIVPGQDEGAFENDQWPLPYEIHEFDVSITHGWPWPYLARGINLPKLIEPAKRPGWLTASGWTFDGDLAWFDTSNLAADLALSTAILLVIATVFEYHRRRRYRFWQVTLAEMGVLVTLIAVGLARERRLYTVYQQEEAFLREANTLYGRTAFSPVWLRRLVGWEVPYHLALTAVDVYDDGEEALTLIRCTRITSLGLHLDEPNPVLQKLADSGALSRLESLDLSYRSADNSALTRIPAEAPLRTLLLSGTKIDDGAIPTICQWDCLETLSLESTPISDDALESLCELSRIKELNLSGTKITDRGLDSVAKIETLELLSLNNTDVTITGLINLAALPRLRHLTLYGVTLTTQQAAQLAALSHLEYVHLPLPSDDGEDLRPLAALKQIRAIRLQETYGVQLEAINRILSGCEVSLNPSAYAGLAYEWPLDVYMHYDMPF